MYQLGFALVESKKGTSEMEEAAVDHQVTFPAHQQTAVVAQPDKGAFDLLPLLVAALRAPILSLELLAVAPVRADHLDAALLQTNT